METSTVGISGVSLNLTIPPSDVSGTDAPIDASLPIATSILSGINARDHDISSETPY